MLGGLSFTKLQRRSQVKARALQAGTAADLSSRIRHGTPRGVRQERDTP